jgi:hypothetical protein
MSKKVTFSLAPEIVADATEGIVLGDFNNWLHETGVKLKKQKDGSLKASINLEPGIYQYRYFLNDGRWVNDGNATGYSFNNEFCVDNCVIAIDEEVKETVATAEAIAAAVEVKPKKAVTKKAEPKVVEKPKATVKKPVAPTAKPAAKAVAPKATAAKAPAKKVVAAAPKKAVAPVAKKATKKAK